MKKILFALMLLASPLSFAQEAKGIIEKVKICGTGKNGDDWVRTLQFQIDGKWFGTYADHMGTARDLDNSMTTSLIFMAYSQKLPVHIKATAGWNPLTIKCGVTDGNIFHRNAGDFIEISR